MKRLIQSHKSSHQQSQHNNLDSTLSSVSCHNIETAHKVVFFQYLLFHSIEIEDLGSFTMFNSAQFLSRSVRWTLQPHELQHMLYVYNNLSRQIFYQHRAYEKYTVQFVLVFYCCAKNYSLIQWLKIAFISQFLQFKNFRVA